jgi:serine/threonine protein kinase
VTPPAAVRFSGSLSEEEMMFGAGTDNSPAELYAEAKSVLERRVADGRFVIGDCSNKTRLVKRIGGGSFGEVYLGLTDSGVQMAVKVELACCPIAPHCLLHEGDVYRKLAGCAGVPNVLWFGMYGSDYSALVMDLLGPTLYGVWAQLGQQFSMKTLLMVVDQTLETIADVHSRGFVHRDISPSNFMLGSGSANQIYLIDFGQAKRTVNKVVMASRQRLSIARPVVGTPRFTSIFAHAGLEPSFRDDIEALGYMWIYLALGRLPWQGIRDCGGQAKITRIGQLKVATSIEVLCAGLPEEFAAYLTYARSLRPHDKPDYTTIRGMFRALGERLGIEYDWKFDWLEKSPSVATNELIGLDAVGMDASASDTDNPTIPDTLLSA